MKFQHIRHATHRLEYNGVTILVDPVFSPKGAMPPIPGAPNQSPNPLKELPMPAAELADCSLVMVTHLHRDHFDEQASVLLGKSIPVVCSPHDAAALRRQGFDRLVEIDDTACSNGIRILRTGGTHGTGPSAASLNPVSGYVLSAPEEPTVYITSDTVWCPEMEQALSRHQPDYVICYGGSALYQGDTITMNIRDFEQIRIACPNARLIIIHLEGWNHCGLTREEVWGWIRATKQEPWVQVPVDGEVIQP